jgi:osmoprotectant transport system permease protein
VEPSGIEAARALRRAEGGDRVTLILQGLAWIFDSRHWSTTALGTGIPDALAQHLLLTLFSLVVTVIIALPLGLYIGHTGHGRTIAIVTSNVSRALPTLGLLAILLLYVSDVTFLPSGYLQNVIVFALLGIPPMLAGAYTGLESVDRQTIDAARAVGMTEWQVLAKVEIPLGASLILGGLRATTLQIIATVTIASLYGQVSLGTFLSDGLAQADYVKMTAGAIMVAALALIVDGLLALIQRLAGPRGVSRGSTDRRTATARGRKSPAALTGTLAKEGN